MTAGRTLRWMAKSQGEYSVPRRDAGPEPVLQVVPLVHDHEVEHGKGAADGSGEVVLEDFLVAPQVQRFFRQPWHFVPQLVTKPPPALPVGVVAQGRG